MEESTILFLNLFILWDVSVNVPQMIYLQYIYIYIIIIFSIMKVEKDSQKCSEGAPDQGVI